MFPRLPVTALAACLRLGAFTVLAAAAQPTAFAQPPIIQPGAPGEESRRISAQEAIDLTAIRFSAADVQFVQGMIVHHAQALDMAALVDERTAREPMRLLARRIALSQEDEIKMMQDWLRGHGLPAPDVGAPHEHDAERMPGMATAVEMAKLGEARGHEFDSLFLTLMIEHHRGGLTMIERLLDQPGSAQDSVLYELTADIGADQSTEIERMDAMLGGLSPDPRVGLKAGFRDAAEVAMNLALVASLPKPAGFFDPQNPAGRPMERVAPGFEDAPALAGELEKARADHGHDHGAAAAADGAPPADGAAARAEDAAASTEGVAAQAEDAVAGDERAAARAEEEEASVPRPSLLNFANSDIVFAGGVLVAGNYHGFNLYDLADPRAPELLSSVVCPGGQGDVSIVGHLLIYSVEQTRGRLDCGLQGVAEASSAERFRGIRIFDVSDYRAPRQVAAVQTCRGSHTHTVVTDPDDDGNIYVYGSGTSRVRPGSELEGCSNDSPFRNPDTALFRIDVIQIPVNAPQNARIVNRPYVFTDRESGVIAGLWEGGNHGPNTQRTRETDQCHDITAFAEIGLAAGACSGNGILLDISDPVNPVRVHEVVDPGFAYWHSATFNNDGTKVIFTDEWGGGSRARCRASDPKTWGADAIYDIVDRKMQFRGYFKMPAPQSEQENCVAHNGSLVPVPGRDLFVQAWYQGGISVVDFTDSSNPVEIAFFDRGPLAEKELIMGGYWSAYWYAGLIYGTEIARGLDVFELVESDYLSRNEIAAAARAQLGAVVNPQQQRRVSWPADPVVARAYLDQLVRGASLGSAPAEALARALGRAETALDAGTADGGTAGELEALAATLPVGDDAHGAATRARLAALAQTLTGLAARLR